MLSGDVGEGFNIAADCSMTACECSRALRRKSDTLLVVVTSSEPLELLLLVVPDIAAGDAMALLSLRAAFSWLRLLT